MTVGVVTLRISERASSEPVPKANPSFRVLKNPVCCDWCHNLGGGRAIGTGTGERGVGGTWKEFFCCLGILYLDFRFTALDRGYHL